MQALRKILDEVITLVMAEPVFSPGEIPDIERLHNLIGAHKAMITVHRFGMSDFFVYLNDAKRDFYGFETNDVSHMNSKFYFRTYHPRTYFQLAQSYQFFKRDNQEYLEAIYKLRTADGSYTQTSGISKTVTRDKRGVVEYIISITCRNADMPLTTFDQEWGLDGLSERHISCLRFLFEGLSNGQIAEKLKISEKTVEKDLEALYSKSGIHNRKELVERCFA